MGKGQNHKKHNIQESQEVNPLPAYYQNAARNRQDSMTDIHKTQITKTIHIRSTASHIYDNGFDYSLR